MKTIFTIPVGEVAVRLIEQDDRVCMHMKAGGGFEPGTLAEWARLCSRPDCSGVIDVGAYTGLFAISAALHGVPVLAFEPLPKNADRLRRNAELNGVDVNLVQSAVSDRIGRTEIGYSPNVVGMTSGASLLRKSGVRLPVDVVTIDGLGVTDVSVIKIDVERAEPQVLAGARETLAKFRPTLIVEVLDVERGNAVEEAVPDYRVEAVLDGRNWLMVPR